MKQQLPAQKVGNRSGLNSKNRGGGGTQKPVRRGRDSGETFGSRIRKLLPYAQIVFKMTLAIALGAVLFMGYRAAASASFFEVRKVETSGTKRASIQSIEMVVRQAVKHEGVWRADLSEISKHLEQLPWVQSAIVTRVLPDGVRVRIVERQPRAVVRMSGGRFMWVDEDAVLLDEMKPVDPVPSFFLRGWNEEDSATARAENRQRVAKLLELQTAWNAEGVSERVSEINLQDLHDVRAQLAGDDSQIEIRLGGKDQAHRLAVALKKLDEQRQTPRGPYISYIDLSQGIRVVVGLHSGRQAIIDAEDTPPLGVQENGTSERRSTDKPATDGAKEKDPRARNQPVQYRRRR